MVNLDPNAIAAIDLTELSKLITDKEARDFFVAETGEHYKLLAHLSSQLHTDILDIGTFKGCSALALSYNSINNVDSYDIGNHRKVKNEPRNIRFWENGIEEDLFDGTNILLGTKLIFLDTVHDGIHERKVIDFLIKHEWKGVLVLDDIHHFPEQNKLWNDIKLRKEDITHLAHWSGTGIIYFE